jgi:7-cyano-7-deazaguanine synthase in queuosine biosynthesis
MKIRPVNITNQRRPNIKKVSSPPRVKTNGVVKVKDTPHEILNLSGGVDSTYALWSRLKASKERLVVHHVHLVNKEGRCACEAKATASIIKWLHENNLGHFDYVESFFDETSWGFIPEDWVIITCLTALLLTSPAYKEIDTVIVPVNKDEEAGLGDKLQGRNEKRLMVGRSLSRKNNLNYIFPIMELTKSQIIKDMSPDLFKLTWYCRRPNNGNPCHMCTTCALVDMAKNEVHCRRFNNGKACHSCDMCALALSVRTPYS